MIWSSSNVLHRLFSYKITIGVLVCLALLFVASSFMNLNARERNYVSLQDIHLASLNLAQLRNEASMFDRYLLLVDSELANPLSLTIHYDILWNRFTYLLNSVEASVLRRVDSNTESIEDLYTRFNQLSQPVADIAGGTSDAATLALIHERWDGINVDIRQMVIKNLIDGESGNITEQLDRDLNQIRIIKVGLLVMLWGVLVYCAFSLIHIRKKFVMDSITRTYNRNYLQRKCVVNESDTYIAVEIQNSQQILTEHGGAEADTLVRLCAERLSNSIQKHDLLIHTSYCEFVIVKKNSSPNNCGPIIDQLIDRANFEWTIGNTKVPIRFVAGVDSAVCDKHTTRHWHTRHRNALRALNYALEKQINYRISDDEMRLAFNTRAKILRGLVKLLRHNKGDLKLWLVYQPIVTAMFSTRIAGAEVLLRGRLNDEIDIPPNQIVNICEQNGLGKDLGIWILRQAALESAHLFSTMNFNGFLSINLNPSMICEQLPDILKAHLLSRHIPARQICLEVTEDNAAIDFKRSVPVIQKIRGMGIQFALDDFGTGYSSLEYLHRLEIDKLKIDRCFVADIETNAKKSQFLAGIISIASKMGVQTIVEGIETREQGDIAIRHGADYVQGFYYYMPMEAKLFHHLLMVEKAHDIAVEKLITG
ncbi:GGDEF domain-containing phosphodiesterase [Marinobacter sp. LV10MA510-1]|uniref:GGDEF domain-containing phosphodiesterase n=1 Tax=Marinobacter sp. LV10MA510-1 TaxID=1415567 RepID=UPI000BFAA022|nr:GGDEF domain-containing phosphodiesterase [Marinobacter sp. LV10MA510-1]PFG07892.1 EAL domain-containing protein (putative c-di-GMP-specific phosphodiesterase class I) [Marinobacter sp. LV10MA510-1]